MTSDRAIIGSEILVSVRNPIEKPWVGRVQLDACYEAPTTGEVQSHRWDFRVPRKEGVFELSPWKLDVAVPDPAAFVQYEGVLVMRGQKNRPIEQVRSQQSFFNLDPRWIIEGVGVDPALVDWNRVSLVVADLFQLDGLGQRYNIETIEFRLIQSRSTATRYYDYQVAVDEPEVFNYQLAYYERSGQVHIGDPVQSGTKMLVLPPSLHSSQEGGSS